MIRVCFLKQASFTISEVIFEQMAATTTHCAQSRYVAREGLLVDRHHLLTEQRGPQEQVPRPSCMSCSSLLISLMHACLCCSPLSCMCSSVAHLSHVCAPLLLTSLVYTCLCCSPLSCMLASDAHLSRVCVPLLLTSLVHDCL